MNAADVIIVGGGPAGTAAALTLARYCSLNTVLFERGDYSQVRIGETIGPGAMPLLTYLGVADRIRDGGHLCSHALAAAWGSKQVFTYDFLFAGRGEGWQLNRSLFDATLAEAARLAGAKVETRTRVRNVALENDGLWHLSAESHDGVPVALTARFVIDASGRSGIVARTLGAKPERIDHLIGVVGYVQFEGGQGANDGTTFVESVPEGWWYSTWLPGDTLVVAFMSDADLIGPIRDRGVSGWIGLLSKTNYTRDRVVGGRLPPKLFTKTASSHLLRPPGGKGWLAAGDALTAFDPLSSIGIGHALASGSHAARAVEASLRGDAQPAAEYTTLLSNTSPSFLRYDRSITGWSNVGHPCRSGDDDMLSVNLPANCIQNLPLRRHEMVAGKLDNERPSFRRRTRRLRTAYKELTHLKNIPFVIHGKRAS